MVFLRFMSWSSYILRLPSLEFGGHDKPKSKEGQGRGEVVWRVDRWLHHRLPSTAPPGLIDTPQRGVRRVSRGATSGERGHGAGFHNNKNSLNLMPLLRGRKTERGGA